MPSPKIIVREFDFSHFLENLVDFPVAVVGTATRGPINEKTLVTTQEQLLGIFGEPHDPDDAVSEGDETKYPGVISLYEYLKIGRLGYFVRVAGDSKAKASGTVDNRTTPATTALTFEALEYGTWFNTVSVTTESAGTANATEDVGPGDGTTLVFSDTLVNLPITPGTLSLQVLAEDSTLMTATDNGSGVITGTYVSGTIDYATGAIDLTFTLVPRSGESIDVTYTYETAFKVIIKKTTTGRTIETFTSLTGANVESSINDVSEYLTVTYGSGFPEYTTETLSGGDDGLTDPDYVGDPATPVSPATGLQIFRSEVEVDAWALAIPGVIAEEVQTELIDVCESRKDCVAFLDTPSGHTPSGAVDFHNGDGAYSARTELQSTYAAIYYTWIRVFNPFSDVIELLPPTAAILYAAANTVENFEVFFAMAGNPRGRIPWSLGVQFSASEGERDVMYDIGTNSINPIIDYPGVGTLIFGQKTLARETSALNRLNVRFLLIFIRRALRNLTTTLLFEPNDPTMWSEFRNIVEPFLQTLQTRRGVTDFRVIMDETTTSADDIDNNVARAKILIKPTKAAEVIIIDINILRQGADFDEFIGTGTELDV